MALAKVEWSADKLENNKGRQLDCWIIESMAVLLAEMKVVQLIEMAIVKMVELTVVALVEC